MANRSKQQADLAAVAHQGRAAPLPWRRGSQAVTGFPAVHSQEPKVLRYLGTAVNQSADITKKVKEDTGITIEYIPVTTDDVTSA